VRRLKDIMKKMGINKELESKKIKPGEKIIIGDQKDGGVNY
jgi:hypothetical protein